MWANPDLLPRDNLAPMPLVDLSESFLPAFAKYIERILSKAETDSRNHNLARMSHFIKALITYYETKQHLPPGLLEKKVITVDDALHNRHLIINLGGYAIRYFSQEKDKDPPFPYRVIENTTHRIGKYLYKQKLERMSESNITSRDFDEFRKLTFMGDGPKKATEFFTRFKKACEGRREDYNYALAKLTWIWEMEGLWKKAEDILRGRDIRVVKQEERRIVETIGCQLVDKHADFMLQNPLARFLKNDSSIEEALDWVRKITGLKEPEIVSGANIQSAQPAQPIQSVQPVQEVKPTISPEPLKEETKGLKSRWESLRDRIQYSLIFINWKRVLIIISASVAVSYFLYFVLPVNHFTQIIGLVVPMTLFVYLLIKKWSWRYFFIVVGLSALLSLILPIPWGGLATAIVIITLMIYQRRSLPQKAPEAYKPAPEKAEVKEPGQKPEAKKPTQTEGAGKPKDKLKDVHISRDILFYMFKIIGMQYGYPDRSQGEGGPSSRAGSSQADVLDTRTVLDAIFRLDPKALVPNTEAPKKDLRQLVREKLKELEDGINYDFHKESERLKNWRNEKEEDLANSLHEVSQEVARLVLSYPGGKDRTDEMLAIQELVAEYYGIEEKRVRPIRLRLVLANARDQVNFDESMGTPNALHYYNLGRLEFYFANETLAEEAFSKAVAADFNNADYHLTLGLVRHFLKRWNSARENYEISLKFREARQPLTEVDKLKITMTKLLIKKVENKILLDGKKENGEAVSQIGKLAEVRESTLRFMNDAKIGWVGVYKKGTGEGLGDLELVKKEPPDYTRLIRPQLPRNKVNRDIVLSMLGLLEKSPPAFYSYDILIEDLCGFTLPAHNLIAVNSYFANNPIAIFHEVGHYLIDSRFRGNDKAVGAASSAFSGSAKGGGGELLSLKLNGNNLIITINNEEKPPIRLSNATLRFIQEENWPEDWQKDQHYLLRVLQKELFGEKDEGLTAQIRKAKILSARANRKAEKSGKVFENYYHSLRAFVKKGAESDDITVISAASGPDIRDVYNATGFTKAYFIDKHRVNYDKLQEAHNAWDVIGYPHNFFQHRKTYGFVNSYDYQEDVAEIRLIQELKDLGVNKDEVEISAPTSDGQRPKLRFRLHDKWREIEFIQAHLPRIDKTLAKELQGSSDVYFQKASQDLPRRYSKYLGIAANWVKIGGVMMLNDCGEDGLFVNQDPEGYLSENFIPVAPEDLKKQEAKVYKYTRKNYEMAFYGWRMSVWEKRDVDLDIQGFDEEIKDAIREEVTEFFKHFREEAAAAHVLVRPYTLLNDLLTKEAVKSILRRTAAYYVLFLVLYFLYCAIRISIPSFTVLVELALGSFGFVFLLHARQFYKNEKTLGTPGHTFWSEHIVLMNRRALTSHYKAHPEDNKASMERDVVAHEIGHLMIEESLFFADAVRTIRKYERKDIDYFPEHREGVAETLDESGVEIVKILQEDNGINDLVKELETIAIAANPRGDQWWLKEPDWAYDFGIMFGTASLKLVSDKIGKRVEDFNFDDYQAVYDFVRLVARGWGIEEALEDSVPPQNPSQMGKRARVVSIVIATPSEARGKQSQEEIASLPLAPLGVARNDKFVAKVQDSKGEMHVLTLEPRGRINIDWLKSGSEFIKGIREGHKEIVLSMLELLESSPPELCTYKTLIEDLFWFPSTEHKLIALHEKIAYETLAQFHEILEYLIDKGLIQLEFKEETPSWIKRITLLYKLLKWIGLVSGRIVIKDRFGIVIGEVTVRRSALSIALKDIQDKHYLIRALQRSVFGRRDKELTNKIKWYQKLNNVGLLNVYERLKYDGYKVIGVDSSLDMADKLRELTGVSFLANHKTVYSPLLNNSISINFAETAIKEVNRVAASIKGQGRKDMRILVIGSGTGIDAMTAFYHAKVKNGIEDVHVDAIDIDKDAVKNTRWNIKLAGKAYEEAIHPRLVKEGKEFDELEGPYDLILFNAPNAVQLAPGEYSSAAYMDEKIFIRIMQKIKERLSPNGAAVIENLHDVMSKRSGLMPQGLEGNVIFRLIAWFLPVERAIFRFTLKSGFRGQGSGDSPPVVTLGFAERRAGEASPKAGVQGVESRQSTEDERIKAIVSNLVNALIIASEKKEKTLLALDTDLGKGEINRLLQDLIKVIPTLENNNKDLKMFLGNLIMIKGTGKELGARLNNIKSVEKENIILITKNNNLNEGYFDEIKGLATIASVDDSAFPETSYLPLLEIMLFTISKYLNWPAKVLEENYKLIPNVISVDNSEEEDYKRVLFGADSKTLVIRLIPDAVRYEPAQLRSIMAGIIEILRRA